MRTLRFHAFIFIILLQYANCWTSEDLELFDLVESTPQNFYDILGVDSKASSSDIRKAYRKLSTQYHPDRNKEANAEETFRTLAAVADVLRDEERRKMYDVILQSGLPDWRTPIYYYRRARNMGLLELAIFLLGLTTLGQYLFAWASYWEKKYEIEENVISRIRKKTKNPKKCKITKEEEDATISFVMSTLPKPRCRDLFPLLLLRFIVNFIISSPRIILFCIDYIKTRRAAKLEEEEEEIEEQPVRVKIRKNAKSRIPDYSNVSEYGASSNGTTKVSSNTQYENEESEETNWDVNNLSEHQVAEFKKALKKFPVGTLQRWEKVSVHLGCSVADVTATVKQFKNQKFNKGISIAMQGLTGTEKENFGFELFEEKGTSSQKESEFECQLQQNGKSNHIEQGEKFWKQEEQQNFELALQKFPKDTSARWEKIASFVGSKTKEECIQRYKVLVQQVKQRKNDSGL